MILNTRTNGVLNPKQKWSLENLW